MNFIKKHWLPIVLVLAIILSWYLNRQPKNTPTTNDKNALPEHVIQELADAPEQCFLYREPVQLDVVDSKVERFNQEFIRMSVTDKGLATGQHLILPFEKDANRADFVGIAEDHFVNVVATTQAEGETWQEQRVYKIEPDRLLVGYQKVFVPQYKNEHGIYLYEDINQLVFETDKYYLSRIDCSSVDF